MKDSKVSQARPSANFGAGAYLRAINKQGGIDRSYLGFSISLENESALSHATLNMTIDRTGLNATGHHIDAFFCPLPQHDFDEHLITWNTQTFDDDCYYTDSETVLFPVNSFTSPKPVQSFDITEGVAEELSGGDGSFVVVLKSNDEFNGYPSNDKYVQWASSDYWTESVRPKLSVEFS